MAAAETEAGWVARCYYDRDHNQPVLEWLNVLKRDDPIAEKLIRAKIDLLEKMGKNAAIDAQIVKPVEPPIYSLRASPGRGPKPRILGFFWKGSDQKYFVACSYEMKDAARLEPQTIKDARKRYDDWIQRFGEGE